MRCKTFADWNYPREMICYAVHMHLKRRDVLSAGVVAASVAEQPTSANSPWKEDDRGKLVISFVISGPKNAGRSSATAASMLREY